MDFRNPIYRGEQVGVSAAFCGFGVPMMRINSIITHPGSAHRDDFLAVAVAIAHFGCVPVYRREPTDEELQDPRVLVLDTGMVHDPERLNFDHHQLSRDAEPECALSLLVRHLGLEEQFKLQTWWETTKVLDSKGPFVAARSLGLDKLPEELHSPVEAVLVQWFGSQTEIQVIVPPYSTDYPWDHTPEMDMLQAVGKKLLADVGAYSGMYRRVSELVRVVKVDDLDCFLVPEAMTPVLTAVVSRYRDLEFPGVAVSVTKSDRAGESWALYRYDDHPRVDFSRLSGDQVVFAHKGGFIAKLSEGVSEEEAVAFVRAALV